MDKIAQKRPKQQGDTMKRHTCIALAIGLSTACAVFADGVHSVQVGGQDRVGYQAAPMASPRGGNRFKASNFLHPLQTPSGFTVTQIQPRDHMHHLGVWWPWKHVETKGRKILFWELQQGDGIIEAQGAQATADGFTATSHYRDRRHPGGTATLLHETVNVQVSDIVDTPAAGYFLDLEIIQQSAVEHPITVTTYRYSGFAIRGTAFWTNQNSTCLTSEGKDRGNSNATRARWVRLEGATDADGTAGIILMTHPENFDYPEWLRTWDRRSHNGAFFINFNSVQKKPWRYEPGERYTRRYRMFVYDGTVTPEQADALQRTYAAQSQP